MKQIIQDLKNGNTILEELPTPKVRPGTVLIRTTHSLVSLGTERMLVEFGKAGYIQKAKQQPDRVKQVLDKMKAEGILPTLEAVFNKLNQPLPLGYCNAGVIVGIGKGVHGFNVGDRVASNGNHAEFVCVPENLVAKIPDNVSDEEATFTVIGSIGLEGIRLANPTIGEAVVVIGLGLIGLVTAELLKANGCKVIGFDFDQQKVDIALSKGITAFNPSQGNDPVKFVHEQTGGIGADAVIITASNKGDEIIHQAAEMSRQRGRIILVGVIGLNLRRDDFYKKELTFQVSCSYGPGRYDENYEQKGQDYPIGYVRWTEKRNFETILHAISEKQLDVKPLISEIVRFEDYNQVYGDMRRTGSIASILAYQDQPDSSQSVPVSDDNHTKGEGVIGIIGAGNFTSSTLLPNLRKTNVNIKYIADLEGLPAKNLAKRFDISNAVTDHQIILNDKQVDTVMVVTRHNAHAGLIIESLKSGKNVFVEKPLCLNEEELNEILATIQNLDKNQPVPMIVVGFNRRFAPLAQKMKQLLGEGPKNIVATMNAGFIPPDVWVHDLEVGGGRIIGEAVHYIDLCTYLSGSKVKSVCMNSLGINPRENTDNASILLKYENGTNAVINYFANGSKAYSKERIEAYNQERTLIIDNWRVLKGYGIPGFSRQKTRLDKGHKNQFGMMVASIKRGESVIPFDEILNTTRASFAAILSLKEGKWIDL